jgi:hypothetical protein
VLTLNFLGLLTIIALKMTLAILTGGILAVSNHIKGLTDIKNVVG